MAAAVPSAAGGAAAPVGDDTARLARKEKMDEFVLMVTTSSRVLQDRYKAENELLKSTEAAVRNSWTEVMRLAKVRHRERRRSLSARFRSILGDADRETMHRLQPDRMPLLCYLMAYHCRAWWL